MKRIKSVLKNPSILLDLFYQKHLGLIFIQEKKETEELKASKNHENLKVKQVEENLDIIHFYQKIVGRNSFTKSRVEKWKKAGHQCWGIYMNGELIGCSWLFFDKIKLSQFSLRTLSKKSIIHFDENVAYQGFVHIKRKYRGKRIYENYNKELLSKIKNSKNEKVEKIILITNSTNGAVINTMDKIEAKLIGIVEVKRIFGVIIRNEKYINKDNKVWW